MEDISNEKNIFKHCFKSIKPNREKKNNMVLVDDS